MSDLLNFLNEHENWAELLSGEPYYVETVQDGKFYMLKYNQIKSDFNNSIVRECRGSIVVKDGDEWVFACRPFKKFGNAGESYCPDINWNTASVQQKVDGSLIKFWTWDGECHISTNGTIDAANASTGDALYPTFKDLVTAAMPFSYDDFSTIAAHNCTYMFELTSPYNKIVIPYEGIKLWFLGWRDNKTGKEFIPEISELTHYFELPCRYSLSTYEDVVAAAQKMGWDEEGFVVCDANFNRVKIKSPLYVQAHHLKNNGANTNERLMDIILDNEVDEFLIYCPEYKERIEKLIELRQTFATHAVYAMRNIWHSSDPYATRAEYAKQVQGYYKPYQDFLFHCFDERIFFDYAKNWSAAKWIKTFEEMEWI